MERAKVVARYLDGKLLKGFTINFFPNKDIFHLSPPENPTGYSRAILLKDLKAVFFVRDFAGNPEYHERKRFDIGEAPRGHKVEVTFKDGEVMVGSTLGYGSTRDGFFITPADPQSNNLKVYAISTSVTRIRRV
jgi:hypothetical protein